MLNRKKRQILAALLAGVICMTSVPALPFPVHAAELEGTESGEEDSAVYLSDRQWLWAYAGVDSKATAMYGDAAKVPENAKKPQLNRRYENSASWSRTTDINLCYDVLKGVTKWDDIFGSGYVKTAEKGIGTTACSEIVYELEAADKRFCATIGFDASVLTNGNRPSSVEMKVLGSKTTDTASEYEELYTSGVRYTVPDDADKPYFMPQEIDVSVEGYKYLKLWVSDAGNSANTNSPNNNPSDAVNWAWARILQRELTAAETLEKAVADAEKLDESGYLADSWTALQNALDAAKSLPAGASDEQKQKAAEAIRAAVAGLRKKADKSSLEALVNKVAGKDFTGFDAALVEAYESALAAARAILADENLSEAENAQVQAALQTLQNAYDALLDTVREPEGQEFDWVSALTPSYSKVGYGSLGIDKTVSGSGTLKLGGVSYERGLGAHAPAELIYDLDGKYQFFHAVVGIDDTRVANTNLGTVQFQVFIDDETEPAFESSVMGTNAAPEVINLPLDETNKKLRIVILTPGGKNTNDWTDVADAKLYLNEKGLNYAEQTVRAFEVAEQANRAVLDTEKKTIKVKVPYGTDLGNLHISNLETAKRTTATMNGQPVAVGDVINARNGNVVITVANKAGETTDWTLIVIEKEKKAILDSDNQILKDTFYWASHKVDQFVMTGQSGLINKASNRVGTGPVDYIPSYWAGYYDRTAFYGRDFCHQATGGQLGGLREENFSMFKTFAQAATEERKYYTLWAFNFDGSNYLVDYKSDSNFVREVPAQFELVQRAYEQYQWTGDERYINDEDLFNFYTNVMTKFVELHDDQNPNGVAEGYGGIWAGTCTYNERGEHPIEAGDGIGSQYQATLAYAGILEARGETLQAAAWYQKAQDLKDYFNKEWSANPDDPTGNYARVITNTGEKLYDFGKENSWFMPMKLITEPGERTEKYLDFISEQLGNGIGDKNAPNAPKNIEAYTYIPDTYFPYDRNAEAWKWMRYIAGVKDDPHERPVQGTNGDYPEISFTFVSQTIQGIMGIEPDAGNHAVATGSHLVTEGTEDEKMSYVDITDIRMGTHMLDVRHDGRTMTTLQNHSEDGLTWEARFYGSYDYLKCGEEILPAKQKKINGVEVSYLTVDVAPEEKIVVSVAEGLTAEEGLEVLKKEIERLEGELAQAEAEETRLTQAVAEAQKSLEEARTALEKAEAEAELAEAEAEAALAREAAAILRAETAEKQAKLLEEEAKNLRAQAGTLKEEKEKLQLEKQAAESEKAAAEAKAAAESERAAAAEERANAESARADAAEAKAAAEELKAKDAADKAQQSQEEADRLRDEVADLTDEKDRLQAEKDAAEAEKAAAEAKAREEAAKAAAEAQRAEAEAAKALEAARKAEEAAARAAVLKAGDSVLVKKIFYTVVDPAAKTVAVSGASSRNLKSLVIPATIVVNGTECTVTEIAAGAFEGCKKLTKVTVGENVKKIGKRAFYNAAKLRKVTVKSTVLKSIGAKAFGKVAKKVTLTAPKSRKRAYLKLMKKRISKTTKIK